MAPWQSNQKRSAAPIRDVQGHRFRYLGQLAVDGEAVETRPSGELFQGIGVRLYQELEKLEQYLCIESAETGEEAWYRVDGTRLTLDSPKE